MDLSAHLPQGPDNGPDRRRPSQHTARVVTLTTSTSAGFRPLPAYQAVCCPAPPQPRRRTKQAAEHDLADHLFATHGVCHPVFCTAYRRHGTTSTGRPRPCP